MNQRTTIMIECLGHASYLVTGADGTRILFDPVLKQRHQEGLLETYPSRVVRRGAVSRVNLVFISHRHMDHFDVPSLRMLDRSTPVIIPNDKSMARALKKAGFRTVVEVEPHGKVQFNTFLISPTQSLAPIPECGFLIEYGPIKVWNQVDSAVSAEIVDALVRKHRRFDLALVQWQPLQDQLPANGGKMTFPYEAYGKLLDTVRRLSADHLVLGACGFRYTGSHRRLNHVVFPQSRIRAVRDFNRIKGHHDGYAFPSDPGDLIRVGKDHFSITSNAGVSVRRASSWQEKDFDFCPWNPSWTQRAPNGSKRTPLINEVAARLRAWKRNQRSRLMPYHRWEVIYNLRVIDGTSAEDILIDFRRLPPVLRFERSPDASIICFIRREALRLLLDNRVTWDRVILSGDLFQWHRVYRVTSQGMVVPSQAHLTNPLFDILADREVWLRYHLTSGAPQNQN